MTKPFALPPICATFLALIASTPVLAQQITQQERAYVGEYIRSERETQSQIAILDDKTFCFVFMGGSLDMLVGGRWKSLKSGGIELLEVRPEQARLPAAITKPAGANKMLVIEFDGYSLGEADHPVFGVSATDELPTMRPLFPEESSSWAESYKLPPMAADKARYIFIGDMGGVNERGRNGDSGAPAPSQPKRIKITQYKIENAGVVRMGFDTTQARPIMNMTGQINDNTLRLNGEVFGRKIAIRPNVVEQAHENCIDPALYPDKPRAKKSVDGEELREDVKMLKPVKTFYLDAAAFKGTPYFPKKD